MAGAADDTGCDFLHVDMDAFFASVEVRRRPQLRGRQVIVGGMGARGVVCSASYEARRRGVHSAMPMAIARRHCPSGVFLPPDFDQYHAASRAVMEIFHEVTPLVEPLSLDEAFLDVSGAVRRLGPPARIANGIRARVFRQLGLTCSVGVAGTMFMAKLGSGRAKPDGMLVIPVAGVLAYLHPLPVSALWGVGQRTAEALHRLGLRTVGDVAQAPIGLLRSAVGKATAGHLHELANGRDQRQVTVGRSEKSVGAETTFDEDVADLEQLRLAVFGMAGRATARLRRAELLSRTVAVKVRFADFRTVSRSRTLVQATNVTLEVFSTAWDLVVQVASGQRVRLVGVRLEGLVQAELPQQLVLGEPDSGWVEAERAADAVADRFGAAALRPASLLGRDRGNPDAEARITEGRETGP